MTNVSYEFLHSCLVSPAVLSDEADFTLLKTAADDLGQAAVSGSLSESIGFNVSSVGVIPPPPPASDPDWNKVNAMTSSAS